MFKPTSLEVAVTGVILGGVLLFAGCSEPASQSQPKPSSPVERLVVHLVGVHAIKESPSRQYVAHHYCEQLSEGLIQCAVFDSGGPGAKLMDVEYVVSDQIYRSFTNEEQQYWHPHDYEVDGGLLSAPDMPSDEAKELLAAIRSTHGKTWHLWAAKENPYPLGKPDLVWSITGPGQLLEELQKELGLR